MESVRKFFRKLTTDQVAERREYEAIMQRRVVHANLKSEECQRELDRITQRLHATAIAVDVIDKATGKKVKKIKQTPERTKLQAAHRSISQRKKQWDLEVKQLSETLDACSFASHQKRSIDNVKIGTAIYTNLSDQLEDADAPRSARKHLSAATELKSQMTIASGGLSISRDFDFEIEEELDDDNGNFIFFLNQTIKNEKKILCF